MERRTARSARAVAAALTAAALTSGCAQWGAVGVGGVLGGGLAGAAETAETTEAIESRPSLRDVFRDGRYRFGPMPRRERKVFRRNVEKDPAAKEAIVKLRGHAVVDRRDPGAFMRVTALVFTEAAASNPTFWEGFVRGFAAGQKVDERKIGGVDSVYQAQGGARVLALRYAPDVVVSIIAGPPSTRSDVEDLARYLLRNGR